MLYFWDEERTAPQEVMRKDDDQRGDKKRKRWRRKQHASMILDSPVNKKESSTRWHTFGHCVRGSGREEDCRKMTAGERNVPEIHVDYMVMEDEKERSMLALLFARERERQKGKEKDNMTKAFSGQWCRGS